MTETNPSLDHERKPWLRWLAIGAIAIIGVDILLD